MKKVVIFMALQALVFSGWSQDSVRVKQVHYDHPDDVYQSQSAYKGLIADETKITDLKASVKVETQNEEIYNKLSKEMQDGLKYITIRKDKQLWVLYFKKETRPQVMAWFKKLNGD